MIPELFATAMTAAGKTLQSTYEPVIEKAFSIPAEGEFKRFLGGWELDQTPGWVQSIQGQVENFRAQLLIFGYSARDVITDMRETLATLYTATPTTTDLCPPDDMPRIFGALTVYVFQPTTPIPHVARLYYPDEGIYMVSLPMLIAAKET